MRSVVRLIGATFFVVVAVVIARPVQAQATAADSAAILLGAAKQLRVEGRTTLSSELLDFISKRYPQTPAAAEAQQLLAGMPRRIAEDRPGRTELLVWSTIYGAALGATLPAALEADEPAVYGLGLIAGAPAGFFAARAISRDRFISEGQARAITFGGLWGAWQGLGWMYVLGGKDDCQTPEPVPGVPAGNPICFHEDPSTEAVLRSTIVGSLAGIGTGMLLSQKPISSGTASTVNFGALWGTWFGTVAGTVADDNNEGIDLVYPLVGGDVGLLSTALLAPKWELSRNRARLISVSGLAGGVAGAGLLLIMQNAGDNAILVPAAGSAIGLAAGAYWTRNYDEVRGSDNNNNNDGGEALLNMDGRKFALDMPTPSLTLLQADAAGRTRVPAVHVPLLKARF